MERLKNMELKKTFLVLSASCVLVALLMLGLVFMICNSISSTFPSGGIEILADGSIVKMEPPPRDPAKYIVHAWYHSNCVLHCSPYGRVGSIRHIILSYQIETANLHATEWDFTDSEP